jgi:hypothetical protein
MSELSSISESQDASISESQDVRTPYPSYKKTKRRISCDYEGPKEEDFFVGTSPVVKSTFFSLNSPLNSRFKFGEENLAVSSTFSTSLQPQSSAFYSPSSQAQLFIAPAESLPSAPSSPKAFPYQGSIKKWESDARSKGNKPKSAYSDSRDLVNEFFRLNVESVKLKLPCTEHAIKTHTQAFYKKAHQDQVPFNKLHSWLESQFASAYYNDLFVLAFR